MASTADIPIQNIYYLLSYAWDVLDEAELVDVRKEDPADIADLFAKVLVRGTDQLRKKGFYRDYLTYGEETSSLRGKLDLPASINKVSWLKARMVCELSELSYDCLPNQILKATMRRLLRSDLKSETADEVVRELRELREIRDIDLTARSFKRVQLGPNFRFYRFLLQVCELIYDMLLPDESGQVDHKFRDFWRKDGAMRSLFEKFVCNFYQKKVADEVSVGARKHEWQEIEDESKIMPTMTTDVEFQWPGRCLIMDCKFTARVWDRREDVGSDKDRVRTGHLYQMYAYLMNAQLKMRDRQVDGILLYPQVEDTIDESVTMQGHSLKLAGINLNQHWSDIERDLLALVPQQCVAVH